MKLRGLKVIEFSLFLPGPHLTMVMADHGAEVVKIENVNDGEPNREIGLKRDGVSVFFANTHRGKKSLALNLKHKDAVEAVLRLAEQSDVIVESFRPGVIQRLGLDYETVRKRAPHIVYISISAFGQNGPYVKKPAHDLAVEARAGILSVNEGQDGRPTIPAIANADMLSATYGLSAVLMALLRRKDTGDGDFIDMAMMDSLLAAIPNNVGPIFAEQRPPNPKDERSWGGNAMYGLYETKDGRHVALGGAEMHFAEAMFSKLGRPDLVSYCAPPPGPNQNPARDYLRDIFKTRTLAEWVPWFEDIDCAFAPVNNLREGFDDPQVQAREMRLHDARGWEHIGTPLKFQNEPAEISFDLPGHGAHSEEILRGLGFDDAALAAMAEDGAYKQS